MAMFREFHDTFAMDAKAMSHVFPTFKGGELGLRFFPTIYHGDIIVPHLFPPFNVGNW